MPFIAIALIATLALGGGLSVAAQNSQQGDALYSYKTAVNDNVQAGAKATASELAHVGASIQSALTVHSSASTTEQTSADVSASAEASTSNNVKPSIQGLRVRGDDGMENEDSQSKDSIHGENEDGTLQVNVF